jgi:alpha-tubulin suppressor-like RCC1 family protein
MRPTQDERRSASVLAYGLLVLMLASVGGSLRSQTASAAEPLAWSPAIAVDHQPPAKTPCATAVSAGGPHACVLLSNGSVDCWGWNEFGQLGDDTTTNSDIPVAVSGMP